MQEGGQRWEALLSSGETSWEAGEHERSFVPGSQMVYWFWCG